LMPRGEGARTTASFKRSTFSSSIARSLYFQMLRLFLRICIMAGCLQCISPVHIFNGNCYSFARRVKAVTGNY
jgi:hypothetical protein